MNFVFSDANLTTLSLDVLAVGVPAGQISQALDSLDSAAGFNGALKTLVADEDFKAKAGSVLSLPTLGRIAARRLLLVGLGDGKDQQLRYAAGMAGSQARTRGARSVGLAFPTMSLTEDQVRAVAEAVAEGNYRFDKYKAEASRKASIETLTFAGAGFAVGAISRAEAAIEGQQLTRDLVNEPAAEIYPETLAKVAASLENEHMMVTVWDEVLIREKGMGGITAVGQGSVRPPRFVHMRYVPTGTPKAHIALVGKGVTFDSGGLSLKPSDSMITMRCDMAGAAAVIGVMKAISKMAPQVQVEGIFGAVENMPSGNSYKLGDVLKMYNGKRIEIHNTDAEGRLVLADCLSYASELKPQYIVDLATLTGAAVVALGDWYTALYSRSDEFASTLLGSANTAGEGLWRMPLADLYMDKLKSDFADMKNVGNRWGGSITAALFLSEFVKCDKWAHLDIAGPAFLDSSLMHYAPGGTGTMVRTLLRWIESIDRA